MKKILIVINPHSGTHSPQGVEALSAGLAREAFPQWEVHTHVIDDFESSQRRVLDAVQQGYYAVAVVGGDGTVNTVGGGLCGSDTALGIIPAGSGNGVARHVGMELEVGAALRQLFASRCLRVDTLRVNGRFCLGFAGLGFEAAVAHDFARSKFRGLVSYTTSVLSQVFLYHTPTLEIEMDGRRMERTPFTMTLANSSQWGFDFRIAPAASMCSGAIEAVILSDINQMNALQAAYSLYKGRIDRFPSCETIRARQVVVCGKDILYHIDGEPCPAVDRIEAVVEAASLKLLSPSSHI